MKKCDLRILKNETEKILDCVIELAQKYEKYSPKIAEFIKPLQKEKDKLERNEYVIAFLGSVKAGKSTLINLFLDKNLNPTQHEAKTALPNLITYKKGQTTPILEIKNNKFKNLVNFQKSSVKGESEIYDFLNKLNEAFREFLNDKNQDEIDEFFNGLEFSDFPRIYLDFNIGFDLSYDCAITFVDTPGANEKGIATHLNKIFKEQLQESSKIVLVVDYTSISKDSDNELIDEFIAQTEIVSANQEAFLIIANKIDTLTDKKDKDKEEIKNKIYKILNEKIDKDNILPFSGKFAQRAKEVLAELKKSKPDYEKIKQIDEIYEDSSNYENTAKKDLKRSNFDLLREKLQISLKNTDDKIVHFALKKVNGILEKIGNFIEISKDNSVKNKEEIEKSLNEIKKNQEGLNKNLDATFNRFKQDFDILLEKTSQTLSKYKTKKKDYNKRRSSKIVDNLPVSDKAKEWLKKDTKEVFVSSAHGYEYNEVLENIFKFVDETFEKSMSEKEIKKKLKSYFEDRLKEINEQFSNEYKNTLNVSWENLNDDIQKSNPQIENIRENLGKNIKLDLPNLDEIKFDTDVKVTQTRSYWTDDDGWWAKIKRWLGLGGRTEHSKTELSKEKAKDEIIAKFDKNLDNMEKYLSEYNTTTIKNLENKFKDLRVEIATYLEIKESEFKDKDSDEDMKKSQLNDCEKYHEELMQRIKIY